MEPFPHLMSAITSSPKLHSHATAGDDEDVPTSDKNTPPKGADAPEDTVPLWQQKLPAKKTAPRGTSAPAAGGGGFVYQGATGGDGTAGPAAGGGGFSFFGPPAASIPAAASLPASAGGEGGFTFIPTTSAADAGDGSSAPTKKAAPPKKKAPSPKKHPAPSAPLRRSKRIQDKNWVDTLNAQRDDMAEVFKKMDVELSEGEAGGYEDDEPWTCPFCGLVNPAENTRCANAEAQRAQHSGPAEWVGPPLPGAGVPRCKTCTAEIPTGATMCPCCKKELN